MLKMNTIVEVAAIKSSDDKKTPAYRAPRVIEVGKTSQLLQGPFASANYRDATNQWCNPWSDGGE